MSVAGDIIGITFTILCSLTRNDSVLNKVDENEDLTLDPDGDVLTDRSLY